MPADRAPDIWDRLVEAGGAYSIRPAGMLALDVVRLEAGLILLEVDYTSARHALNPDQNYSPFELGLGRLVSFDKADYVGRRALLAERVRGGPARRPVGLILDWYGIEHLYDAQGLPPGGLAERAATRSWCSPKVVARSAGRRRTAGALILKQAIALACRAYDRPGARLEVE